jgi:hypothetical protein
MRARSRCVGGDDPTVDAPDDPASRVPDDPGTRLPGDPALDATLEPGPLRPDGSVPARMPTGIRGTTSPEALPCHGLGEGYAAAA